MKENCLIPYMSYVTSLVAQRVKRLPTVRETWVPSLGQEDPLEKGMATHSSTLAWKIPWTEEPGGLQSMGSQRVGYDWATSLSFLSFFLASDTQSADFCQLYRWVSEVQESKQPLAQKYFTESWLSSFRNKILAFGNIYWKFVIIALSGKEFY